MPHHERPPTADQLVSRLGLCRHPEGGFYRETFRLGSPAGGRGALSLIYFLVRSGQASAWHRIDAAETWHHYLGAPLLLRIAASGRPVEEIRLGTSLRDGERPQGFVPAGVWQSAAPLGEFSLVGCVSVPAFEFSGFELAPPGWTPDP